MRHRYSLSLNSLSIRVVLELFIVCQIVCKDAGLLELTEQVRCRVRDYTIEAHSVKVCRADDHPIERQSVLKMAQDYGDVQLIDHCNVHELYACHT